jgi:hypothetical protein
MSGNSLRSAAVILALLAPAAAFAAAGDPDTGAAMGSKAPNSQAGAASQDQGGMNGAMKPMASSPMTGSATDPAATNGKANMPERGDGDGGAGDKAGEGK